LGSIISGIPIDGAPDPPGVAHDPQR